MGLVLYSNSRYVHVVEARSNADALHTRVLQHPKMQPQSVRRKHIQHVAAAVGNPAAACTAAAFGFHGCGRVCAGVCTATVASSCSNNVTVSGIL
jgi:hypothetical protein